MRSWREQQAAEQAAFDESRRAWITTALEEFRTLSRVVAKTGISRGALVRNMHRYGLHTPTKISRVKICPNELARLIEEGLSNKQIAAQFGVTPTAVSLRIQRLGLPKPNPHKREKQRPRAVKKTVRVSPFEMEGLSPLERMKLDASQANQRMSRRASL